MGGVAVDPVRGCHGSGQTRRAGLLLRRTQPPPGHAWAARPHATPPAPRGRSSCGDREDTILRVPYAGVLRRRPAPVPSLPHQVQRFPGAAPRVTQAWSVPRRAGGVEARARLPWQLAEGRSGEYSSCYRCDARPRTPRSNLSTRRKNTRARTENSKLG